MARVAAAGLADPARVVETGSGKVFHDEEVLLAALAPSGQSRAEVDRHAGVVVTMTVWAH